MATVLFDGTLRKDQDWGDPQNNGQPASGRAVQQFIKDTLNKKFGYLDYHRDISQYYVFADQADAEDYNRDPITYVDLLLAQFNAPAPYELRIPEFSETNVTTLLSAENRKISFRFFILDKTQNPNPDNLSIRVSITTSSYSKILPIINGSHTTDWNVKDENGNYIGSLVEIPLDEYLTSEDTYTISLILTGNDTKVTGSLTFTYKVVALDFDMIFDDNSIPYYPFDNNERSISTKIMYNGAPANNKIIDIFIDGEELNQSAINGAISSGDVIGSAASEIKNLVFYNKDAQNNILVWPDTAKQSSLRGKPIFSEGKHTLQIRIKISPTINEYFYSKSKYYEFVVVNSEDLKDETYLLYLTDIEPNSNEAENPSIFGTDSEIILSGTQYNSVLMNIIPVNTRNNNVNIIYNLIGREKEENITISHGRKSGEQDEFNYIFNTIDTYDLNIYANNTSGDPKIHAEITITGTTEFGVIEEQDTGNLLVKYTALNRSNSEVNAKEWKNSAPMAKGNAELEYPIKFNNVLFNDQCGWDGQALVLRNGATIEVPVQLFDLFGSTGLTFEIDFETFDVTDDDAVILDYSDPDENNKSYLRLTAVKAETLSNNMNAEKPLKTNYKDGSRTKIAFVYNPTSDNKNEPGVPNPNLILIFVNGVLDRACKWGNNEKNSDSLRWNSPTVDRITIGDSTGAANMKIYSIRIYGTCYTTEQAFMNYVVDQGSNIPTLMRKNNVLVDGNISLQTMITNGNIPILLIETDYKQLNNATNKKQNTQFNGQFFAGNEHPELGFYVRNGYMCLQGTSSMNYPTKNLRPYFNKTGTSKNMELKVDTQGYEGQNGVSFKIHYKTEFWPYSEYGDHTEAQFANYIDEEGILPYQVSSKEIIKAAGAAKKDKKLGKGNAFHIIGYNKSYNYIKSLAKKYAAKGELIFAGSHYVNDAEKDVTETGMQALIASEGKTIDTLIDEAVDSGLTLCITAYRPLRRTNMTKEEYWFYIKQLRYSNVKIYTRENVLNDENQVINYAFTEAEALDENTEYYGLGGFWRQYNVENHYSVWTDRWTLKADFAESSMTHNGGIGALWGRVLKTFTYNGSTAGETKAQAVAKDPTNNILSSEYVDIRTSCDSKPIVLFVRTPQSVNADGTLNYSDPTYAGIFNIMTDKSSIPAFGFKNIKNHLNKKVFDAKNVQCWEFLNNGSTIATGLSLAFNNANSEATLANGKAKLDSKDNSLGYNIGEGRPIFDIFESRWPECGADKSATEGNLLFYQDDVFGVPSNNLETFLRWLHFCRDAVDFKIDGQNGYQYSPYIAFASTAEAAAWKESHTGEEAVIYLRWEDSGNYKYCKEGDSYKTGETHDVTDDEGNTEIVWETETFVFNPDIEGLPLYRYDMHADFENITKKVNTKTIKETFGDVYVLGIEGFDAKERCFAQNEDGTYSTDIYNSNVYDKEGNLIALGQDQLLVDVYLRKEGTRYMYESDYTDAWVQCTSARIADLTEDNHINVSGKDYNTLTFMDYFEATANEHLDIPKVAAYYVYIIRFGAVDQVVKNCMLTTEDGKRWYFINYDNDTVLGVRNDATLIFNWDFDRTTYDYDGKGYAYAGYASILWNTIETSEYFMNIVKTIATTLHDSGLLTAEAVLSYLNENMMGTWCERLYNAQEEIKYLSTFKRKFDDKYLKFVQGTRQSHRNWWVSKRWELYDSVWDMGTFFNKFFYCYINSDDGFKENNPGEFVRITSASKYNFRILRNGRIYGTRPLVDLIPLKRNETFTWNFYDDLKPGDPLRIDSAHKIKVLNLRPSAKYNVGSFELVPTREEDEPDPNNPNQMITVEHDWVKDGGTYMVKFLLGNGVNNPGIDTIAGINSVISLEDIDLRGCNNLSNITLNQLINLHRFRASNSSINTFTPAQGVVFYEVSLPTGLQNISLRNTIFTEQKPDEYIVYQTEKPLSSAGVLINDALPYAFDTNGKLIAPYTGNTGAYTNRDDEVYKYTSESKAIFDYKPTRSLKSVTFANVQGFDTLQFIRDLKEVVPETQLPNTILNLTGINWSGITVSELIELYMGKKKDGTRVRTFKFEDFGGIIKVVSDEPDPNNPAEHNPSITFDEYNRIKEEFGEEVFSSDENQKLRITTEKNTFFTPTDDTRQVILESYPTNTAAFNYITGITNGNKLGDIYQVIRGDEFKVKATIFPIDNTVKYKYVLTKINSNNTQSQVPARAGSNNTIFENTLDGVTLTNINDYAVLKFTEGRNYNANNAIYIITVVKEDENGNLDYNPNNILSANMPNIYVGSVSRVIPSSIMTKIDNVSGTSVNINDENHHVIEFNLGETTNADIKTFTINYQNTNNIIFDKTETGKYDYTIVNNKLSIGFTCNIPEANLSSNVGFIFEFATSDTTVQNIITVQTTINIQAIYANEAKLVLVKANGELDEDNMIVNNQKLIINKPGNYKYKLLIGPDNYNIPLTPDNISFNVTYGNMSGAERVSLSNEFDEENNIEFTINGLFNGKYTSIASIHEATLTFNHKYESQEPVVLKFTVETKIIYPDSTYISVQDYENNRPNNYIVGKTDNALDIYLLNNKGTRGADASSNFEPLLTNGSGSNINRLNVKLNVHDLAAGSTLSDFDLQPTVDYYFDFDNLTIEHEDPNFASAYPLNNSDSIITSEITHDDENIHGNNILSLSIQAVPNTVFSVKITGQYTIRYDNDFNVATEDLITTVQFTVRIHYTLANYTSYKKIKSNEWYLVDKNSNFYQIDIYDGKLTSLDPASMNQDPTKPESDSDMLITKAQQFGVEFIGVGHTYGNPRKYLFMALLNNSDIDTYTSVTKTPDFALRGFFGNMTTPGIKFEPEMNNGHNDEFAGNYNTERWIKQLTERISDTQLLINSNLYKIYFNLNGKLDYTYNNDQSIADNTDVRNNSNIQVYIPMINELTTLMQDRDKFDIIINAINAIYSKGAAFDRFITIEDFRKVLTREEKDNNNSASSLYKLASDVKSSETIYDVFAFISSSVQSGIEGLYVVLPRYFINNTNNTVFENNYSTFTDILYTISYILANNENNEYYKYFNWRISILPLLKLS